MKHLHSYLSIASHVFTANHITRLPTATLSIDQSSRQPGFLNFQLTKLSLDSEDGFRIGCRNVSHHKQSQDSNHPDDLFSIKVCHSWVQTIFFKRKKFKNLKSFQHSPSKPFISTPHLPCRESWQHENKIHAGKRHSLLKLSSELLWRFSINDGNGNDNATN